MNRPDLKMARKALTAMSIGLFAVGGVALQGTALAADADEKAINVRDSGSRAGDLRVNFEPLNSVYEVDEPIRFRVRGNKTFFLYVYTVDKDTGNAVLLLPNRKQTGNKYPGGSYYNVPNRSVEFYADERGQERIVMVASSKYIDVDRARFKSVGDFAMVQEKALEDEFEAKGIRIRRGENRRRPSSKDVIVKDIDLAIVGKRHREDRIGFADRQSAIPFVSTVRDQYYVGEKMRVVFGADKPGYVHLYTVEPGGSVSLLTRRKVDGESLETLVARAEAPLGEHALVALWSKGRDMEARRVQRALDEYDAKAIRIRDDEPRQTVRAVKRFRISR